MAIDSREKRMSMLGFGGGHNWDTLFEADSAVNADDRAHMLDLYSGFGDVGSVIATVRLGADFVRVSTEYVLSLVRGIVRRY